MQNMYSLGWRLIDTFVSRGYFLENQWTVTNWGLTQWDNILCCTLGNTAGRARGDRGDPPISVITPHRGPATEIWFMIQDMSVPILGPLRWGGGRLGPLHQGWIRAVEWTCCGYNCEQRKFQIFHRGLAASGTISIGCKFISILY